MERGATLTILLTLSVYYITMVSYAYNCRVYRDNIVSIRAGRRYLIVIIIIVIGVYGLWLLARYRRTRRALI